MFFASDNSAPAHPNVIEAIVQANQGYAMPYGADALMESVRERIREVFEAPEAAVYLVATGTAANATILSVLCKPWETIFCHRNAHIEEDECGAPEFFTGGAKLALIEGEDARMSPEHLEQAIKSTGRTGVHNVQRGMVSLTNSTEHGAIYSADQVVQICDIAKQYDLPVHMDGARFANALVSAGCTPAEITWKAGVDALSFGGTKNGLLGVEAVVFFDPRHAWEFELRRKRGGHLFSKHRYLSAQMDAYLQNDLWLGLAQHANAMAARLSSGIQALPGAKLLYPTQANAVFASWPRAGHRQAHKAGAAYYLWPFDQSLEGPDNENLSARMVCSWSTAPTDVDDFLAAAKG